MSFKFSTRSKRNLRNVKAKVFMLADRSLQESAHDFGIPNDGGYRTALDQNKLFTSGRGVTSKDGFIRKSYHQSGLAFDMYYYDGSKANWEDTGKYKEIAKTVRKVFDAMKKEGIFEANEFLIWGGDWKKADLPHFQISKKNV